MSPAVFDFFWLLSFWVNSSQTQVLLMIPKIHFPINNSIMIGKMFAQMAETISFILYIFAWLGFHFYEEIHKNIKKKIELNDFWVFKITVSTM